MNNNIIKGKYTILTLLLLTVFLFFFSREGQNCLKRIFLSPEDNRLEKIFISSEENRNEIQSFLDHYSDDPQKLEAAKFIVLNMPGHYGTDLSAVNQYKPYYDGLHKLRFIEGKKTNLETKDIDSLWTLFRQQHSIIYNEKESDLKALKSSTLIDEFDLAYKAWQENTYTRNCSFSDFCEYILPYRRANGLVIDSARHVFYKRHHGWFTDTVNGSLISKVKSLLFQYKDIEYTYILKEEVPTLNAATLESISNGICNQRCWYNSLLLSALGVPVSIDYIPAWGGRNGSHSWNVVIDNEKNYPIDPFWQDDDFLKYRTLYDNTKNRIDDYWGEIILPKVFRQTYSDNKESLLYKGVSLEDIPPFFYNTKLKDVSSEYFKTTDVEINLTIQAPSKAQYAFLCVFNNGIWQPAQWGKIKQKKAIFKDMGRGTIYLPVYYSNRQIKPAAIPFLIQENGDIKELRPSYRQKNVRVRNMAEYHLPGANWSNMHIMKNSRILGLSESGSINNLLFLPDVLRASSEKISIKGCEGYQYVQLQIEGETLALGEISFYGDDGKILENVQIRNLSSKITTADSIKLTFLVDGYDATCCKINLPDKYIDFDLGEKKYISAIRVVPYYEPEFNPGSEYELFYWEDGWRNLGSKEGSNDYLTYENVPQNALLRVTKKGGRGEERIFLYEDGKIHWY